MNTFLRSVAGVLAVVSALPVLAGDTRGIGVRRNSSIDQISPRVRPPQIPVIEDRPVCRPICPPPVCIPRPRCDTRSTCGPVLRYPDQRPAVALSEPVVRESLLSPALLAYAGDGGIRVSGSVASGSGWVSFRIGGGGPARCARPAYVGGICATGAGAGFGGWGAIAQPVYFPDPVPQRVIGAGSTVYDERTLEHLSPEDRERLAVPVRREVRRQEVEEHLAAQAAKDAAAGKELPPLEKARQRSKDGDTPGAITALRLHLKDHPEDHDAMRALAVAMVRGNSIVEASALMRAAYHADPSLADRPFEGEEWGLVKGKLRDVVTAATSAAHKHKSGSAWLTVTVLMQSEGRLDLAQSMLERGEKAGLEIGIVAPIRSAIEAARKGGEAKNAGKNKNAGTK